MKNAILILFGLLMIPFLSFASSITVTGQLSGNITWNTDTVIVDFYVTIPKGTLVTVADGTTILFTEGGEIQISGGTFIAIGGKKGITFNSQVDGKFWDGFKINTSTYKSTLELKNVVAYNANEFFRGSNTQDAVLKMDSCQVLNSNGIYCIISFKNTQLLIENSHFNGGRGGLLIRGDGVVRSCIIENFIENGGVKLEDQSSLINCLVRNNNNYNFGGGVWAYSVDRINIYNCTIVSNNSELRAGGLQANSGALNLINCIIWGNSCFKENQNFHGSSKNVVLNCNIDEDLTNFYLVNAKDNIRLDPMFIDFKNNDHRVKPESPVINAGRSVTLGMGLPKWDLEGNARILQDNIDMGAYESEKKTTVNTQELLEAKQLINVYPNPANNLIYVDYGLSNSKLGSTTISFYSATGILFESKILEQNSKGTIFFNVENYPAGLYLICLDGQIVQKVSVKI